MSTEQNRRLVEDYMNAWASADAGKLEGLLDNNYKFNNPPPGITGDKQGAIEMAKMFRQAFPDMSMKYSKWVADGENVAVRCVATGTHQGDFMGVAPTGKYTETTGLALVTVRNGKVVEDASEFDMLGLLTQLGAIPPMGGPSESGESSAAGRPARPSRGAEREHGKIEDYKSEQYKSY